MITDDSFYLEGENVITLDGIGTRLFRYLLDDARRRRADAEAIDAYDRGFRGFPPRTVGLMVVRLIFGVVMFDCSTSLLPYDFFRTS